MLKYIMARTTRSARVRALEKLQKILDRGRRNNTRGMDHFFWENNTAVWRNPYDLGASKEGSFLLDLNPDNRIVAIHCDDAGPQWDLEDENGAAWESINISATELVKFETRETLTGFDLIHNIPKWDNTECRSKTVIYERVMRQWRQNPGLQPVVDTLFPSGQPQTVWHYWAQYLSEAMKLSHSVPKVVFEHEGVTLNTQHFLGYLVALSAKRLAHPPVALEEQQSIWYPNARMRYSRKNAHQTQWDWNIFLPNVLGDDLFSRHCYARMVWEEERGPFMNVMPGRNFRSIHESSLVGYTQSVHAMLVGRDNVLTAEEACHRDCQKIIELAGGSWDRHCTPKGRATALDIIVNDWWCDNPTGQELIQVLDSLYAWKNLCTTQPQEAWTTLVQMALSKVQAKELNQPFCVAGDLFQDGPP